MDLRDIVIAAVAEILHDHGPTNSDHLKATDDWRDCARSEVHAEVATKVTDSPLVVALLDVLDESRDAISWLVPMGKEWDDVANAKVRLSNAVDRVDKLAAQLIGNTGA